MSVKLSLFTRLTVKLESPHAFTFLFNKPTALELLTINNQTAQIFGSLQEAEDKATAVNELLAYQVSIVKQYCTEVHGLEDDNGVPIALKVPAEILHLLDYLPLNIMQDLFGKFLAGLNPSLEEKKS